MRRRWLAVLAGLPICLACVAIQRQVVRGVVTRDGRPAVAERFVVAADPDGCSNPVGEVVTDAKGAFELSHEVGRGAHAVIVQPIALCQAGETSPLWSTVWGPAPARVELRCELATSGCTSEEEY